MPSYVWLIILAVVLIAVAADVWERQQVSDLYESKGYDRRVGWLAHWYLGLQDSVILSWFLPDRYERTPREYEGKSRQEWRKRDRW